MYTKPTIMITGAGGLIGSSLLRALAGSADFDVIAVWHAHHPPLAARNIRWLHANLTVRKGWTGERYSKPEFLIHCAAHLPRSHDGSDSHSAAKVNGNLDKMAIAHVREWSSTLIYISTAAVYGTVAGNVSAENSDLNPAGAYAEAKAASESQIVCDKKIERSYILRVSAPYGPNQRAETVLTTFVRSALAGEPLRYYGTGLRRQDFIYVEDIAAACLSAIRSRQYGIYNIASGQTVSMRALAKLVIRLTGSSSPVVPAGIDDPQESFRPKLDISKAGRLLNWRPACSLEQGLRKLINHMRERTPCLSE